MADRIHQHQKQCMAKLTDRMLEKIATAYPTKSVTDPELRRIVAQRLIKMIPNFHTPVHTTYAFMIHRAIVELNTEGGSDKESISKFIKEEYRDLPLAHESFLRLHLTKLCEKGEIFVTDCKRYMLPVGYDDPKKQVMKEDGETHVEKNGGGGFQGKDSVLKENEAAEDLHNVIVSSKQMRGTKQNGLLRTHRWSSRQRSKKPQEDETYEHDNVLVRDVTKARVENDATRDQSYHTELSNADHQSEGQLFDLSDEPLEPPGFLSKEDQLIELKQQAQADPQAFQIGVEVEQKKIGQQKIKSEDARQAEKDEANADILQPSDGGKTMVQEDQLLLSTEVITMLAKRITDAFSTALDTWLADDGGQPDKQHIPIRRGRGRPREKISDEGSMVTEKQKKKQGRWMPRKQIADELSDMEENDEVETIAENALATRDHSQQHQPKTTPIESPLEHTPYLKTEKGDEVQDISQQQKPNPARERSFPDQKPGPEIRTVAILSSQAPKPAVIESLYESLSVYNTKKQKAAAPWDGEVVATRIPRQNSNSVNDATLASGSRSQDKEGTKRRTRIERPPKIDEDQHSGYNESLKVKRRRVKGCKPIRYTDMSITDLMFSQDHHVQVPPMSGFLGRSKKL